MLEIGMILGRVSNMFSIGRGQMHTVANNFLLQNRHHRLELKSLQPSECSTNTKIEFNSGCHSIGLIFVKLNRPSSSLKDMANIGLVTCDTDTQNRQLTLSRYC